jgi:hypothetical protein
MSKPNRETITILPPASGPAEVSESRRMQTSKVQPAAQQVTTIKFPFRLPGIVRAGGFMALGAASFFAFEALAPVALKPSYNIGSYEAALVESLKQGELSAQARYEAKLRDIDFLQQERLKALEVAATHNADYYKGLVGVAGKYYESAFTRANTFAQSEAQMQAALHSARLQTAQSATGGLTGMAILGDYVSGFGMLIGDQRMIDGGRRFADQMTMTAIGRVTDAGVSAPVVDNNRDDDELPAPKDLAMAFTMFAPPPMPSFESASLSVVVRDIEARDRAYAAAKAKEGRP